MKPAAFRLTQLETRITPAVATWDGGGADANWTTATNWVGDVAPQPGDDLAFPAGAARTANVNDYPDGATFGRINLTGRNYDITGNRIALANGIAADLPFGGPTDTNPRLNVAFTLTAPQTFGLADFGSQRFLTLAGPIDLSGNDLTIAVSGTLDITGAIGGSGGLNQVGEGVLILRAVNTYTGPTTLTGNPTRYATLEVDGRIGDVVLNGGILSGSGVTGSVSGTNPVVDPGDAFFTTGTEFVGTLTVGSIALAGGAFNPLVTGRGSDRIVVNGTVSVQDSFFMAGGDGLYHPRTGDSFTVIDNDGTDPIQGTFAGTPEGAIVFFDAVPLRITYRGGDGNDVVLNTVRVPSTAVGAGAGGAPVVNVYDADGSLLRTILAYDINFRGGVHVAVGEFTGDGVLDIVTAPGVGGGPDIKVFDGQTGALARAFLAYDANFRGGVSVGVARLSTTTSRQDIITGAGPGGGPHVKVFDGQTGATLNSFLAYDPSFTGGVSVAGIDTQSFNFTVIPGRVVTGAGPGGGPHVRVFDGTTAQVTAEFFAYDASFRGGVNVAAGFESAGTTAVSIVTAPGPGGGPVVRVFDAGGTMVNQFLAYDENFRGGMSVAAGPRNAQTLLTGPASGGAALVRQWRLFPPVKVRETFAFDPAFQGGVFVG